MYVLTKDDFKYQRTVPPVIKYVLTNDKTTLGTRGRSPTC